MILLSIKDYLFIDKDEVAFIFNRRSAQIPNLCSYLNKRKACKFEFAGFYLQEIAERQGFEPWEQLPVHRISSAARSTTPAFFLESICKIKFFILMMQLKRHKNHFA